MPSSSVSGENGLQGMTPDGEKQKKKEKRQLGFLSYGKKILEGKAWEKL